jgi:glycerophosphoryl diester phosphodiesterase
VQQAQAANRRVHAWTANTAGMMRAVLDAGVDAVVTNHPQKLAEALRSRLLRCQEDDHEGL